MADGLIRSGVGPALLGHGQSRTGLERRFASRRQPLHLLSAGDRSPDGEIALALPVHAARRTRLGLEPDTGADRHAAGGQAAQGRRVREPQCLLLPARPRDGRVPPGDGVLDADLGPRHRQSGPADSAARQGADGGREPGLSQLAGRDELDEPFIQPGHEAALCPRSRDGLILFQGRGQIRAGQGLRGRRRAAARRRQGVGVGPCAAGRQRRTSLGLSDPFAIVDGRHGDRWRAGIRRLERRELLCP